jgi:hypothetical protein
MAATTVALVAAAAFLVSSLARHAVLSPQLLPASLWAITTTITPSSRRQQLVRQPSRRHSHRARWHPSLKMWGVM